MASAPEPLWQGGLVAADVLAVQWWFVERWFVVADWMDKMAVVCQFASTSSLAAEA